MASKLKVFAWDPTTVRENTTICVLGRRGSGKSSAILSLLYKLRHRFDAAFAFCPTVDVYKKFEKIFPLSFVWNAPQTEESLQSMIRTFTDILEKSKIRHAVIVSDDCAFNRQFFTTKAVRELSYNGRNCNLTWILSCQGDVDLPKNIRTQIDYALLMQDNDQPTRENYYKYFAGVFPSLKEFCRVFDQVTGFLRALVVDRVATSTDISKCVYFYQASFFEKLPPFRVSKDAFFVLDRLYNTKFRTGKQPSRSSQIIIQDQ